MGFGYEEERSWPPSPEMISDITWSQDRDVPDFLRPDPRYGDLFRDQDDDEESGLLYDELMDLNLDGVRVEGAEEEEEVRLLIQDGALEEGSPLLFPAYYVTMNMEDSTLFEMNISGDDLAPASFFQPENHTRILHLNDIESFPTTVDLQSPLLSGAQHPHIDLKHKIEIELPDFPYEVLEEPMMLAAPAVPVPVGIQPLKSPKDKNTPYLLKEDGSITTKNMSPVAFVLTGARPGYEVRVTMRYIKEPNENIPVKTCIMHRDCGVCKLNQRKHPEDFNFCIDNPKKFSCRYQDVDGHPTALLKISDNLIDSEGGFKFHVIFACLNSCNTHRINGKDLMLCFSVWDSLGNSLGEPIKFNVKVCKNVRRDHQSEKEIDGEKKKRKVATDDNMNKKPKVEESSSSEAATSVLGPTAEDEAPQWTCFLMKNLHHQKLVTDLIKELQGNTFNLEDPTALLA